MKNVKIKFIRKYEAYRENWYDVIYYSGKIYTFLETELPKTAREFIETATKRTEQYDKLFKRSEMIYEA